MTNAMHDPRPTPLMRLVACLAILLSSAAANAVDVTFRVTNREVFVGGQAFLEVTVRNARSVVPPVAPAVEGATMRLMPGERTSQQTRIVNGVVDTSVTTTFVFEITATRAGRITIPAVSVEADGETFRSEPTIIVANPSDTGDLLHVEVSADPAEPVVGEDTTLTLRIWLRPYRNPEVNTTFDEADMWSLVDLNRSQLGLFRQSFVELEQQRRRPRGEELLRGDRAYYVYTITRRFRPTRAGAPEIGPIEISVNWPTAVRQARNFFGERTLQVTGIRPINASPTLEGVRVRALPTEGQPEHFSGAVGRFRVEASAKPTDVAVGDPITITYAIIAESDAESLEGVQPPPFAELEELTRDFRIPSDPMAGVMQGNRKIFTQTFRPLTERITEIPALPFAYFDPRSSRYDVTHSEPIPITVRPAERLALSQIVGARGDIAPAATGAAEPLTVVAGGLVANAPIATALLRNERAPRSPLLFVLLLVGPPIAVGAVAIVRAIERRAAADPARRRAAKASGVARSRLARSGDDPAEVLSALTGYVADRTGLAEGARTRPDATRALTQCGVETSLIERVDRMLAECERARYAAPGSTLVSTREAVALLAELDRRPLRSLRPDGPLRATAASLEGTPKEMAT